MQQTLPPGIERVLVTAQEIADANRRMAEAIARDYAGRSLVLIGVLKGALFATADLARALADTPGAPTDVQLDFLAVSSYGNAHRSSGEVRLIQDTTHAIEGRHVLIVEDIVDSGLTLSYLLRTMRAREPASIEVCALLTKPERRKSNVEIRFVGFEIPNRFVIGYGLDHGERFRQLPYVAVLADPL